MATKEELLEKAKELDVEGRSGMNKEELEKAVADAEGSSEPADSGNDTGFSVDGKDSEASDASDEDVKEGLSPSGKEALEEMGEDSEAAKLADVALDASGPLHLQDPADRVMTGAVNEEHAKEQEELLVNRPEDFVGDVTEAGFDEDGVPAASSRRESEPSVSDPDRSKAELRAAGELKQEDVIDFPSAVQADEDEDAIRNEAASGPFSNTAVMGASDRTFAQKAVFYTDGLGGGAEQNLERAYEIPELLQSNNPVVREAGDESLSQGVEKSDEEQGQADDVKSGAREERADEAEAADEE